ncbi:MAG: hypothetical protein IJ876_06025 [Elusimicrobiaceae bacterium]|nr:hypothetical protein [Elusimicrobiaceae bacterium]
MKKWVLPLHIFLFTTLLLPATAQKLPPGSLLGKSVAKSAVLRPPKGTIASITAGLTDKQLEQVILKLQQQNAALERQIALQQTLSSQSYQAAHKALFRALASDHSTTSLSGTLFKTTYNGQEEVFGVVPMHVLRQENSDSGYLPRQFTAGIFTGHTVTFIPAQVVQLSSSKTADVALVKFREEDQALLEPLTLHTQPLQFPQQAYAQGFARNLVTHQAFQLIGTTSTGVLTAQIPAAYEGERAGFCGSPVVGEDQQLLGIHIGSRYVENFPQEDTFFSAFQLNRPQITQGDIGYMAPASFLEQLVDTYHHPDLRPVEVVLGGQTITHLAVNEYVSRIELLGKASQVLWSKDTNLKVSWSAANAVLRLRSDIAYIKLYIGRTHAVSDNTDWFVKDQDAVRTVLYPYFK